MPLAITPRQPRRRTARAVAAVAVAVAVAAMVLLALLTRAGRALVVDDGPGSADVIVVLAGHAPHRLRHGLALYRAGYAPRLIVSDERLRALGMDVLWTTLYRDGRVATEVPPDALLAITDPTPQSTLDEAQRTAVLMRQHGLRSAILVTDEFHSRRSALMFGAEFRRHGLEVRSSPARWEAVDLDRWWERPRSRRVVLEEYAKLLVYVPQGVYW